MIVLSKDTAFIYYIWSCQLEGHDQDRHHHHCHSHRCCRRHHRIYLNKGLKICEARLRSAIDQIDANTDRDQAAGGNRLRPFHLGRHLAFDTERLKEGWPPLAWKRAEG